MSKFKEFDDMCSRAKDEGIEVVIISHPQVIGDTYEEITRNLGKLAEAGLALRIDHQ